MPAPWNEDNAIDKIPGVQPVARFGPRWRRNQTFALVEMKSLHADTELLRNLSGTSFQRDAYTPDLRERAHCRQLRETGAIDVAV